VLVIEDSLSGVEAARAAGMTVWGFVGGGHYGHDRHGSDLLAAGAARLFCRMEDLLDMQAADPRGACQPQDFASSQ
jgi:beta-phosphoglucomutase-like phosphatase (HAD superfamily)